MFYGQRPLNLKKSINGVLFMPKDQLIHNITQSIQRQQ